MEPIDRNEFFREGERHAVMVELGSWDPAQFLAAAHPSQALRDLLAEHPPPVRVHTDFQDRLA